MFPSVRGVALAVEAVRAFSAFTRPCVRVNVPAIGVFGIPVTFANDDSIRRLSGRSTDRITAFLSWKGVARVFVLHEPGDAGDERRCHRGAVERGVAGIRPHVAAGLGAIVLTMSTPAPRRRRSRAPNS